MWPFRRRAPEETPETPQEARKRLSIDKRLEEVELELVEVRDTQEKILAAIKKVQGRLLKRVQVAEAALADGESDPTAQDDAAAPASPADYKAQLRQRAWALRGGNNHVHGG